MSFLIAFDSSPERNRRIRSLNGVRLPAESIPSYIAASRSVEGPRSSPPSGNTGLTTNRLTMAVVQLVLDGRAEPKTLYSIPQRYWRAMLYFRMRD